MNSKMVCDGNGTLKTYNGDCEDCTGCIICGKGVMKFAAGDPTAPGVEDIDCIHDVELEDEDTITRQKTFDMICCLAAFYNAKMSKEEIIALADRIVICAKGMRLKELNDIMLLEMGI